MKNIDGAYDPSIYAGYAGQVVPHVPTISISFTSFLSWSFLVFWTNPKVCLYLIQTHEGYRHVSK